MKPPSNLMSTINLLRIVRGSSVILIGRVTTCIHRAEKPRMPSGRRTKMRLRVTLGGAAIRTATIKATRHQEIHGGTPEISTPRIHGGSGAVEARQLKALVDGGSAANMTRSGERN